MLCKVTHCTGHVLANTRPHQLCWGDWEIGTATSCTECSQVAGLIHMTCKHIRNMVYNIYSCLSVCLSVYNCSSCSRFHATHFYNFIGYFQFLELEDSNLRHQTFPCERVGSRFSPVSPNPFFKRGLNMGLHHQDSFSRERVES